MPNHPSEEYERHEALVRLLQALRASSDAPPDSPSAIGLVLRETCRYLGWPLGHAYLVDRSARLLRPTGIWHQEDVTTYRRFAEVTEATVLGLHEGLPGRALENGKPEWVREEALSRLVRADAARAAGIRSGVAVPLVTKGYAYGVLEFFTTERPELGTDIDTVLEWVGAALAGTWQRVEMNGTSSYGNESFEALIRATPDAIVVADEEGRILSWNPSATRLFGYEAEEILGEPLTMIMPEEYRVRHKLAFQKALAREPGRAAGKVMELEGLAKDGRVFPVELSVASWATDRRYFAGILRDVTVRRSAIEELRLHGSAAEHVSDAIVVSTADARRGPTILYVNRAFTRMTGYSEGEVLGRSFGLLAGPKTDWNAIRAVHENFRRGEAVTTELVAYRKNGSEFLLEWRASPIPEPDGSVRHFASIQRDITEDRRVAQALRRADRDPLTDLANREVLERRLREAIDAAREDPDRRYAVLFMDLDGFKAVNDEHGHVVGDQLLASVARRLEHTVRPGDTLARFGGDEFVILLDHVANENEVGLVAQRVGKRLAQPFEVQGHRLSVAASIGVARSQSSYDSPREVIRDADTAMYLAKRAGKGLVRFHEHERSPDPSRDDALLRDLERCLERGELEVHYQPLVDLATESVFGFEALVRWRHAELGLLPPERFIPLAEESGLIVPLGRWILREACATARRWRHRTLSGRRLLLSVNVSIRELVSPGLIEAVRTTLEETGLNPSALQLELTESILADPSGPVASRIEALRKLGVIVCIDDFGSGYSSLGYLHRFPVDTIKIDRVFMERMGEPSSGEEVLRAIVSLARDLGLSVVVEGIETRTQLDRVKDLMCEAGQGYLFAGPIESADVELFLDRLADRADENSGHLTFHRAVGG